MKFARTLTPGRLIRRYKRFLADIELESGAVVTAHCPNPGAMTGLKAEGLRVWVEPNDDPKRKLAYGWRLVELPQDGFLTGGWAGIDTAIPNRVVAEALRADLIPELGGYADARPEVKYGTRSRVDFLLTDPERPDCYVEVKNVHLRRSGDWAEFPDSVTKRGAKHLDELAKAAATGARAVMLYIIQRSDCARMRLAADIDPGYAAADDAARASGVEALAYGTIIDQSGVRIGSRMAVCDVHTRQDA
ncbi:MAG: DNA/RNA nuclease SfsA [Pseudomonadota bacterium]